MLQWSGYTGDKLSLGHLALMVAAIHRKISMQSEAKSRPTYEVRDTDEMRGIGTGVAMDMVKVVRFGPMKKFDYRGDEGEKADFFARRGFRQRENIVGGPCDLDWMKEGKAECAPCARREEIGGFLDCLLAEWM